ILLYIYKGITLLYAYSAVYRTAEAVGPHYNSQGGSTVNKATSRRAMLMIAFFGAGALTVHATGSSCLSCHTDPAAMQKLVVPPSGESAEGEG
ncbi:MAG TPA: hypothetical protein PLW80_08910, partial [Spirochaetales bacterium]|nr:hypothetical protein [Spirochaetales bacterium]